MDVMIAVMPNAPAGTQSSALGTPVNPGSPAVAKGASLATATLVDAGTAVTVPSPALDSAAAGLLFGMVLAQLAIVKETAVKEADEKTADVSQTQAQFSPDQISMLSSLVPALITSQVEAQPIAVPDETLVAGPSKLLSKAVDLTHVVASNVSPAGQPAVQPALATDPGQNLNAGQLHNQGLVLDRTLLGAPQMPVATLAPTPSMVLPPTLTQDQGRTLAPTSSMVLPPTLTQDQGQSFQTFMTPVPSAAEVDNPSGTAAAHDLNAASLSALAKSALAKSDTIPDRSPAAPPPSLLIDATLTDKNTSREDLFKGVFDDKNGRVLELAPVAGEKIPTEFLAGRSSSPAPLTEGTAPQAAAVSAPAASATITPRETIRLDLGPSDLGRVTVQVSVQSQQVQATVGVEHRGLGEFLAAGHVALDQAMRQHGLRLDELHVESILNSDMLGPGDARTGFLDHGQSREDAPGFMREPQTHQGPESEAMIGTAGNLLEAPGVRYRINLFA